MNKSSIFRSSVLAMLLGFLLGFVAYQFRVPYEVGVVLLIFAAFLILYRVPKVRKGATIVAGAVFGVLSANSRTVGIIVSVFVITLAGILGYYGRGTIVGQLTAVSDRATHRRTVNCVSDNSEVITVLDLAVQDNVLRYHVSWLGGYDEWLQAWSVHSVSGRVCL